MATLFRLRIFVLFFLYSRLADAKVEIISSETDIKIGTDQLLLCKAGKEAEIQWLKDGDEIDEDRHVVEVVDETTSKLKLKKVEMKDTGLYTCKCEYGSHSDERNINIFVYEEPNFGKTKTYHEVLVAQTAHIPCVVTGKPNVDVTWYLEDRAVSNDGSGHLTVQPDGTLKITNVQKSDHGTYTCVGKIKERPSIMKKLEISVVVNVSPMVRMKIDHMDVHAGPTTNVTIICLVSGTPKPTISWITPDTSDSSRYIYNSDKSELTIPGVARSDFGEYVCMGTNKLGDESASLMLDVSERPVVFLNQDEMVVKPGALVSVSCNASGHPSPSIEWFNQKDKKLEGSDSELVIKNVQPSDGGIYFCKASNQAGSSKQDFRLITTPAVPTHFTILPGPTSAHITIQVPIEDGGSLITKYVVQWKERSQNNWTQTAIAADGPLVVTSLAPYTEYSVRFAAQNKHLLGGLSEERKIRTLAKREPDMPVISSADGKFDGNSYSIPIKQLDDGGSPILHYVVRYRMNKEGENWSDKKIAGNSSKIDLPNLQYNSDYEVEVLAFNVNGSSSPAKVNFLVPQPEIKPSLGKGGVAGIVIVIFLMLLVAVDAFCCYKNHCGLLNFLSRKLFVHKASVSKSVEDGVINNAAVDLNGLEKPRGSIPKLQAQNGATNGVLSEVTCDKAPLTKFEKPPANGDSSNEARL